MHLSYFMPTHIISGAACLTEQCQHFASLGTKALLVTGSSSAQKSGALGDALQALSNNSQDYVIFDKVMANPTIDCVLEGASLARDNHCDFVLAIGGGSPLDAGKAMAALALHPEAHAKNIFTTPYTKALPIVALPTTAGTGSEATPYAIITDHVAETKMSIATPIIFPRYAYLDAKYMQSLPKHVFINTVLDALSHAIEGMLALRANVISDNLAKQSITHIASCFPALQKGDVSLEQCQELLLASTLAGMVIANTATVAVHAMGYPLTYYKNIDHGRANGLLFPAFMQHVYKQFPQRAQEILQCMNLADVAAFTITMHALLGDKLELSPEECKHFTHKAMQVKNMRNSHLVLTEEDIYNIFKSL